MAKIFIEESSLFAIGDAIRKKTGKTEFLSPAQMVTEISGITAGGSGGTGNLVPLTVTENGTYYPPKSTVEVGNTYTFKAAYTQEELKALYDSALYHSDDGVWATLFGNLDGTGDAFGVMYQYGMYGAFVASGLAWIPEALASQIGSSEGWHQGADISSMTKLSETPSFALSSNYGIGVEDLALLDVLFELPSAADGFSSVEVNVPQGDSIEGQTVHEVTFLDYDGTFLFSRYVFDGDNCEDPVSRGQIAKPTRATDAQYIYTQNGWTDKAGGTASTTILNDIVADKTVYAAYATEYVLYTVNWYNGDTVEKTEQVRYGATVTPPDVFKEGYKLVGWGTEDFTITKDTDFYSEWEIDQGWLIMLERPADLPTGVTGTNEDLAYSSDGKRLYLSNGTKVYHFDTTTTPYTSLGVITSCSKDYNDMTVGSNGESEYMLIAAPRFLSVSGYMGLCYSSSAYKFKEDGKLNGSQNLIPNVGSHTSAESVVFSHDGTLCAVKASATVYIFDTVIPEGSTTWNRVATIELGTGAGSIKLPMAFSPDGTKIIIAKRNSSTSRNYVVFENIDGTWTDVTSKTISTSFNTYTIKDIKYSHNGRYLAFGIYSDVSGTPKKHDIVVFDTSTTPYTKVLSTYDLGLSMPTFGVAFSPDDSMLACVGAFTNSIVVFDTNTWEQKQPPMVAPTKTVYDVAFSPDGKTIALAGASPEQLTLYEIRE